jgi:predicted RNase H-like HicB family nuclease
MQIPILIERVAGNGYRARGAEPFSLSAEGATREEALSRLRSQLKARLEAGDIVPLEIDFQPHPLMEFAGMFKDDPDFEDVVKIMSENRRKMDADPNVP